VQFLVTSDNPASTKSYDAPQLLQHHSLGQQSRHINIRYFFIADRGISQGEVNLVHCPTGIMIADFFTKPLQGALFAKFGDIIMGITHFSTLDAPTPVESTQERVEYGQFGLNRISHDTFRTQ
jgi:hypothetical protein